MLQGGCWRLYESFKGAIEDVKGQDEKMGLSGADVGPARGPLKAQWGLMEAIWVY